MTGVTAPTTAPGALLARDRSRATSRWLAWRVVVIASVLACALAAGLFGQRVVAVGDIHGDYDAFVELLQRVGLIDDRLAWNGGTDILVQTGDFTDRGPGVLPVMDLLMRLQDEAAAAGGKAIVLMGNHEAMNVLGLTRDVHPSIYESLAVGEAASRRESSWNGFRRWWRQRKKRRARGDEPAPDVTEALWKELIPVGYLEYLDAFAPDGKYGAWVRSLPIIAQVGDVAFLHAGIPPGLADSSNRALNEKVWQEIEAFDACRERLLDEGVIWETSDPLEMAREGMAEIVVLRRRVSAAPESEQAALRATLEVLDGCVDYRDWLLVKEDGPLWFRGLARWDAEDDLEWLSESLRARQASHFVVGHTPQSSGKIETRFDGRAILIDTGMLHEVYGGRASALEIENGRFYANYPEGRTELQIASGEPSAVSAASNRAEGATEWKGPSDGYLPFSDSQQVVDFLHTAKLEATEKTEKGINRPLKMRLEKDGVEAQAVWRSVEEEGSDLRLANGRRIARYRDSYRFEVAAFEVDRLLGIGRVPPAVLRAYDGRSGSLQLWVHGVIDEESRRKQKLEPPVPLDWARQTHTKNLFDALIQNFDRNQGNLLIDTETWKVWLIDHTRAFLELSEIPQLGKLKRCERHVWERLSSTGEEEIRARLEATLRTYEIDALVDRWQLLVEHFQGLIEERTEAGVLLG